MAKCAILHDASALTVTVPISFKKRGGRRLVITPNGGDARTRPHARIDNTIVKALARAFRWRRLLESGAYGTIEDISASEKINASYVSRVFRLTLLSPAMIEIILDGRHGDILQLRRLLRPFPVGWVEQRAMLISQQADHFRRANVPSSPPD